MPREYVLVVPRPGRTIHAECRCTVGIATFDGCGRTALVDAVGSERLPDGRLRVILAEHDCDRARAAAGRRGEAAAADLAGEIIAGVSRGGTGVGS